MRRELEGVEWVDILWDSQALEGRRQRIPREPGKGVYVAEQALQGVGIFRVRQWSGHVFCTDPVRDSILEKRYTNVDFLEMGETF